MAGVSYKIIMEDGLPMIFGPEDALKQHTAPDGYCPNGQIVEATQALAEEFLKLWANDGIATGDAVTWLANSPDSDGCWIRFPAIMK